MKSFWVCVIEIEHEDHTMPRGFDAPMRSAVECAIHNGMPKSDVVRMASGWGLNEDGAAHVNKVSCLDKNNISFETACKRTELRSSDEY